MKIVKIKTWKELSEKYGYDKRFGDRVIQTKYPFTDSFEEILPANRIIPINGAYFISKRGATFRVSEDIIDSVIIDLSQIDNIVERLHDSECEIDRLEEELYGEDLAEIRRSMESKIESISMMLEKIKVELL